MNTYTEEELKARSYLRIAQILKEYWEEGRVVHSRMFEILVPDDWITHGRSVKGGGHREHVVPCAYLARECTKMFADGKSVNEVASMIEKYLRIVLITLEERIHMDFTLGLKVRMPDGWEFGAGAPLARLHAAGIKLA